MMPKPSLPLPPLTRSLSARLLLLTIAFVMLGEVLIYVPSIARFRLVFLEERIAAARLAALSIEAAPQGNVSPELSERLLAQSGVEAIMLHWPDRKAMMASSEMPERVRAAYDLRDAHPLALIGDAFETLWRGGDRVIRVLAASPRDEPDVVVEVVMRERAMRVAMLGYSERILTLSVVLSLMTAGLVYLSLHRLLVRPMRRITAGMVAFREAPEDPRSGIAPSRRGDEIGIAQRELARMQTDLRAALQQKTRLAALGAAVSKINHDLKNILSTAVLVSDRIAQIQDPEVKRVTPTLVQVIDRAVSLCAQTLSFVRAGEPKLKLSRFPLRALVEDVTAAVAPPQKRGAALSNHVPEDLTVAADRDQLFRVLFNLGQNAVEALVAGERSEKRVAFGARRAEEGVIIEVADTGPGLPQGTREHLFEPFAGAGRSGGTGLGLAIARDLVRAHGGDIELVKSDPEGTVFRLHLPRA